MKQDTPCGASPIRRDVSGRGRGFRLLRRWWRSKLRSIIQWFPGLIQWFCDHDIFLYMSVTLVTPEFKYFTNLILTSFVHPNQIQSKIQAKRSGQFQFNTYLFFNPLQTYYQAGQNSTVIGPFPG